MGPKKKGGGGKGGGKKGGGSSGPSQEELAEMYQLPPLAFNQEKWVTLHIKLFTWDYMNFSMTVPTVTRVFTIQDKIMQRHGGSVSNLNVYRDTVNPNKLLSDESATLADLGIEGSEVKGETEATLVYDFQPHHSTCPLLNDPPTTLYQLSSPSDGVDILLGKDNTLPAGVSHRPGSNPSRSHTPPHHAVVSH